MKLYGSNMEISFGETKPQPTWRGHTCGECGWAVAQGYHKYLKCRRTAWGVHQVEGSVWCENIGHILPTDPACPAFVLREKPSE